MQQTKTPRREAFEKTFNSIFILMLPCLIGLPLSTAILSYYLTHNKIVACLVLLFVALLVMTPSLREYRSHRLQAEKEALARKLSALGGE